ncbi:MAG: hypothetical protein ACKVVT_04290 [Dehalococcoidia bacterium]
MRRDLLLMNPAFVAGDGLSLRQAPTKRVLVLRGALFAAAVALVARLWMRTVSDDHVFSLPGTTFIVLVFAGMGAAAGLAFAWRRYGSHRRRAVQRATALVPFLLMGPFMIIFLPSLGLTVWMALGRRRRWLRRAVIGASVLLAGFLTLAFFSRETVGPLSAVLYLALAYVMFLSLRIAFAPLRTPAAAAGPADDDLGIWLHY